MADKKENPNKVTCIISDGRDAIEHGEIHVKASVSPSQDGFRRGQIWFPRGAEVVIPADTLNQVRYDAIMNESMLVAVEVNAAPKKAKKTEKTE
jgi:hypothetical protein